MGTAVILALSKQQHLGRVAAGCTNSCGATRQALAVARCRKQQGQRGGQDENDSGVMDITHQL